MDELKEKDGGLCVGHGCEYGGNVCCRECGLREMCDDVCDGPEGQGVDGECEFRI